MEPNCVRTGQHGAHEDDEGQDDDAIELDGWREWLAADTCPRFCNRAERIAGCTDRPMRAANITISLTGPCYGVVRQGE
jgi:hypothetical protein